jgi:hypothetical protein
LTDSPQRYNRENRQADASFQESDLSAFRFDGFDNAHCFAAHGGKDVSRWLRARNLAILNRWVNSDLDLVIKVQAPKGAGVWDFVFRAVHNEGVVKFDALTKPGPPIPLISPPAAAPAMNATSACLLKLHMSLRV